MTLNLNLLGHNEFRAYTPGQRTSCFKSFVGLIPINSSPNPPSPTHPPHLFMSLECLISISSATKVRGLQISSSLRCFRWLKSSWWGCLSGSTRTGHGSAPAPLGSHCGGCGSAEFPAGSRGGGGGGGGCSVEDTLNNCTEVSHSLGLTFRMEDFDS